MAKRFVETKMWDDPWFQELPITWKIVWKYLCDKCDEAGIWKKNLPLAEFQIGVKIKWADSERVLNAGKERIIFREDKWVIKDFVNFQYGEKIWNSSHGFHEKIKKMLKDVVNLAEGSINNAESVRCSRKKFTKKDKLEIFERDNYICQWCGDKHEEKDLIIDHFVPLSIGGNNNNDNLISSCIRCNGYKWNFSPIEFIEKHHSFLKPSDRVLGMLDRVSKIGYHDTLQEEEEEEVKEKQNNKVKVKYMEFVLLTEEQHKNLVFRLGETETRAYIFRLNNYLGSKGKSYKSHYHTILSWHDKDQKDAPSKPVSERPKEGRPML